MKASEEKDNQTVKYLIKKSDGDIEELRRLFRERFGFEATIVTSTDEDFWRIGTAWGLIKIK